MMVAGTIWPPRTTARSSPVPTARMDDCGGLITAVKRVGASVSATHLRAFYTNRSRRNLTPCVSAPAYDAAIYHGHLL